MASVFLPSSASWLVVLAFICSTDSSSRRVDMANSARSWSLSAWISAIDSGVAASSRRMVSRTARLCTSGISTSPNRLATRKPMPKNMIGSIMDGGLRPGMTADDANHATPGAGAARLTGS